MCKRIERIGRVLNRSCDHYRITSWLTCAAIGLSGLAATVPASWLVAAEEPPAAAAERGEGLDSVLVATRQAELRQQPSDVPVEAVTDDAELEPISQVADRTPELADAASAESEDTDQFARALAQAADHNQAGRARPAADFGASSQHRVTPAPAEFNGIQPGTSTKQEVLAAWDVPASSIITREGAVLTYRMEPFNSIDVLVSGDVVSAIRVELQGSLPPKRLAKQLSLDTIDAVDVAGDEDLALGQAYPERGVLFLFAAPAPDGVQLAAAAAPSVTHVVIQSLDANAFALRAESRLHGPYQQNIADLEFALSLDPDLAQAHWLLAEIYLAVGQADQALAAAEEACDLEPENAAYLLRRAQSLKALGRYDEATQGVRTVLDREDTTPIVKAQALHEMAHLASLGDASVASKAIAFDTKAIELADALATSKNVQERRAAKRLLVEAHLAIAREVAAHAFNDKLQSVSQWIGRASGLAEDLIANDGGGPELRLLVAREAVAALGSFKPTKDPEPWIDEAKQAAEALAEMWDDDLWQRRIQWELGQVYFHAVRVEHSRIEPAAALRYGQLAIENLAEGAETRQAVFEAERLVGELYFQIGAVHAIHKQDHKTAIQWYDKAMPLLTAPRPVSDLLAPRRDGEQLVSMGVSYWQSGEKDHAVDLTLSGAKLVEQAVDDGVLPKTSLAVPYSNLATMYQQLGDAADAAKYAQLARSVGGVAAVDVSGQRSTSAARPSAANSQRVSHSGSQPVRRSSQRPTILQAR